MPRRPFLALLGLLAGCTPHAPQPAARPTARPTPSTSTTTDAAIAAPRPAPPADRAEADQPYASVIAPSGLFREAVERAHARLRGDGARFHVRPLNDAPGAASQQRVDLAQLAQVDAAEPLRARCDADASERRPSEAALAAGLRAFVLATPAAQRTRVHARDELVRDATHGANDVHVGCPSRAGNALVVAKVDNSYTAILRTRGDAVIAFTNSALRETTELDGAWRIEDDAFRGDFTGDRANEAIVLLRQFEGPRWLLELYAADATRAARLSLSPQSCAADRDDAREPIACNEGALPSLHALLDRDRWILRVGLQTYRASDDGALALSPPVDPELARWLERVRAQELALSALARALSAQPEALSARRPQIRAALAQLGEAQPDIDRALTGLFAQ
jgi:hypothetical protein